MDSGWIKLFRKFREWGWYKDCKTKSVFLHLLLSANHARGNFQGQIVERGQVITGRKSLSKDLGLSEREVRTALARLQKSEEIDQQTTNRFTIITVMKYDDYQVEGKDATNKTPTNDQQTTNDRPTNDQQTTTNKNEKNNKNEKKKKNYTAEAEEFWLQTKYARRDEDDKAGVLKKYQSLRKSYSHEDLILSVSRRFDFMANWSRKWGLRRMLDPLNVEQALEGDLVKNNEKHEVKNLSGVKRDAWDDLIDHVDRQDNKNYSNEKGLIYE